MKENAHKMGHSMEEHLNYVINKKDDEASPYTTGLTILAILKKRYAFIKYSTYFNKLKTKKPKLCY